MDSALLLKIGSRSHSPEIKLPVDKIEDFMFLLQKYVEARTGSILRFKPHYQTYKLQEALPSLPGMLTKPKTSLYTQAPKESDEDNVNEDESMTASSSSSSIISPYVSEGDIYAAPGNDENHIY